MLGPTADRPISGTPQASVSPRRGGFWYTGAVMAEIPEIEGFVFRQRLAGSSRCVLWRAEQTALERDVLVTVFGPGAALGAIQALAQTKSPLIPEIIDIQRTAERTCVITEDPHARGIVGLLAGRRLDAGQISNLGMRLAEGFAELEASGVVYGGLCPTCLYLSEDSDPVLPDLSPTRFAAGQGEDPPDWQIPMEALPYAAPELQRDPGSADSRADMFALGLTLYALGTGQVPFGAVPAELLEEAKRTRTVPSPCDISPNFPPALAALLARLASRDPADRFADWDEVRVAFHQAREGLDLPAGHPDDSVVAPPDPTARARAGRTIRLSVSDLRAYRRDHAARRRHPSWFLVTTTVLLGLIALALLVIAVRLLFFP